MSQRLLIESRQTRWALGLAALLALLLALMSVAPRARANESAPVAAGAEIVWRCWLDPATGCNAYCTRRGVALPDPALDPALADPVTTQRDLLAGGCVARLARQYPERYGQGLWRIPLHVVPRDNARWPLLLETVMCGVEPSCRVEIGPQPMAATSP